MRAMNVMENAMVGKSFVVEDTAISAEVIDKYLKENLDISSRGDDGLKHKVAAKAIQELYILMKYCELLYRKLRLATKAGYSLKVIKSAVNDSDALELCLENLMMFVYKHIPTVRNRVNEGI